MAVDQLKLQVVLGMVDKASGALDKISFGSKKAADALKTTRDAVRKLEDQQKLIDNYQRARESIVATNAKNIADRKKRADLNDRYEDSRSEQQDRQAQVAVMRTQYKALLKLKQKEPETAGITAQLFEASKKLERLEKSYNMHSNRSRNLKSELSELDIQLKRNTDQHSAQVRQAITAKKELHAAGLYTKALSGQQADLTAAMERANAAIAKQKENLAKLGALQAVHKKAAMHGAMLVGSGMAAQAAGGAIKQRMQTPINDFMAHEDAMMGIARQVQGARDSAGQLTAIYKTAEAEVRKLSTELPLTTVQIAEMMTAAARMEVPTNELAGFTKQVAHMAMAFDAPPEQIAEAMGKVAKNFKIPLQQINGLADTINHLDDNAISKGSDIIDYMNRVSGMAALAKMSSNDYAALGSTLLTLGERTESASTATNTIITKFAMASKGSKKFKAAMGELGLDASKVEAGMATDAMGTMLKVMEKIKAMPEQKQLGIMAELVGQEHADTLAKLINGTEELTRQRKLAASAEAKGSMDREADARKSALSAKFQIAENKVFALTSSLGETLKPALIEVMESTGKVIQTLTTFAQENPGFVSAVMKGAFALAGLLAVGGTLLVTLGPLWATFATGRLMLARLGLGMASTATKAPLLYRAGHMLGRVWGLASQAAGWLSRGLGMLVPVIKFVATAFMWLCRIFLMNPIGLAITAIAAGAYLVYANWAWLKAGFSEIWTNIARGASIVWTTITGTLSGLPQKFMTIGGQIMDGLMGGLAQKWEATKAWFANMGTSITQTLRDAWGIKSPSRVFAEIGGHVMGGLTVGLAKGEADPLARTRDMADKLTQAGAALALPAPTWPSPTAPQLPGLALPPALGTLPAPFVAQAQPPMPALPPMAWPALQGDAMRKQLAGLAVSLTLGTAGLGMPAMAQGLPALAQDLPTDTRTPPLINTAPSPLITPREPAHGQGRAGGGGGAVSSGPIQITINAAPGMDAQAIAKAVAAELDRRERANRSRVRGSMQDID